MARPDEVPTPAGPANGSGHDVGAGTGLSPACPPDPARMQEVQASVLAVWREVLGLAHVAPTDDVFDLGASSVQAIAIVARLRETWDVDIRARDFFEHPTAESLAAFITGAQATVPDHVVPRPTDAVAELSFDQQRLWLEDQLQRGSAYHVHGRRLLRGPLDPAAFETSLRAILARHEALRTRFPFEGGRPVQVVDDADPSWRPQVEDVSHLTSTSPTAAREAADRLADEQARAPFDLSAGPLLRCLLVRVSDDEHLFSVTAHHIVCDAWSIGLFVRELASLYRVGGDATRAGLPDLPLQYRDYAVWQRRRLEAGALDGDVEYWRERLQGVPGSLALPTTRRWGAPSGRPAGRLHSALTEEQTTALLGMCRDRAVTPFMALLGAFATVLGRWSGQSDVVIGVPVAGRSDAATGAMIGFFVNTLPLRVDLSGDPTFDDVLAAVRRAALEGHEHGQAPFDLLVQRLRAPRDPFRQPLFQVLLNVVDEVSGDELDGLSVVDLQGPPPPAKFDLTISAQLIEGRLWSEAEYDRDHLEPSAIETLVGQVLAVLSAAAHDPAARLGALTAQACPPGEHSSPGTSGPHAWLQVFAGVGAADRCADLTRAAGAGTDGTQDTPGDLLSPARDRGAREAGDGRPPADDVTALATWIRAQHVTVIAARPPLLRALIAAAGTWPELRLVVVPDRGEVIGADIVALQRLAPGATLVTVLAPGHGSGPTGPDGAGEPASWFVVPPAQDDAPGAPEIDKRILRLPAGRPGDDARVVVAGPDGRDSTVGWVGEIVVDGRPTGRSGRWRPDGVLLHAGPAGGPPDRDLLEAVAALRDLRGVRDAIVVSVPLGDGDRLVGYVAADGLDGHVARRLIAQRLPDRLVPDHVLVLDELPLTAEGEYDLPALPAAPDADPQDEAYVPPRTPMEQHLAAVLAELLEVQRVGLHDRFFDLGGFSLLATRLTSRIRELYQVELSLRDIFESPTVEGLAQLVVRSQAELADDDELAALLEEIAASGS